MATIDRVPGDIPAPPPEDRFILNLSQKELNYVNAVLRSTRLNNSASGDTVYRVTRLHAYSSDYERTGSYLQLTGPTLE